MLSLSSNVNNISFTPLKLVSIIDEIFVYITYFEQKEKVKIGATLFYSNKCFMEVNYQITQKFLIHIGYDMYNIYEAQ